MSRYITSPICLFQKLYSIIFSENRAFIEGKILYSRRGHTWQKNMAHDLFMLDNSYKYIIIISNTDWFPTAKTVTRTRLNVALYHIFYLFISEIIPSTHWLGLCVFLWASEQHTLFPYTALNDQFLLHSRGIFTARYELKL